MGPATRQSGQAELAVSRSIHLAHISWVLQCSEAKVVLHLQQAAAHSPEMMASVMPPSRSTS